MYSDLLIALSAADQAEFAGPLQDQRGFPLIFLKGFKFCQKPFFLLWSLSVAQSPTRLTAITYFLFIIFVQLLLGEVVM